jgi:methionyl-tRNA formyltransferase
MTSRSTPFGKSDQGDVLAVALCVSGYKGLLFLRDFSERFPIRSVFSYPQANVLDASTAEITEFCRARRIPLREMRRPLASDLEAFDLVLTVGWQFLLNDFGGNVVILHDSLLPRYRGFSPTVAAMINGERQLGVTALLRAALPDTGPILAQAAIEISYPLKIKDALEQLAPCYTTAAVEVLARLRSTGLRGIAQDEAQASRSLWYDECDQFLDWSQDAARLSRQVDAMGFPYTGARCRYHGKVVIVHEADPLPDLAFENRRVGKIWAVTKGTPEVVCGDGLLRLRRCTGADGTSVTFDQVRVRLE